MEKPLIFNRWPAQHEDRIQLYSLATPNGVKVSIALEEMELPYEAHTIDIMAGDQSTEEYKWISPNSKIPTILDPNGPNGEMVTLMESAAILIYLAEKTGKLMPSDPLGKSECLQWLCFQVGHVGPMFGQFGHFYKYAAEKCKDPYPVTRYTDESTRLLGILEQRLSTRNYILGDEYSIVDIAIAPWVNCLTEHYNAGDHLGLSDFSKVSSWLKAWMDRPAVQKGLKVCPFK